MCFLNSQPESQKWNLPVKESKQPKSFKTSEPSKGKCCKELVICLSLMKDNKNWRDESCVFYVAGAVFCGVGHRNPLALQGCSSATLILYSMNLQLWINGELSGLHTSERDMHMEC